MLRISILVLIAILASTPAVRAEPKTNQQKKSEFVDVRGDRPYRLPGPEDCKAVVLIFIGTDCPISNGYSKEIVRLCKEFMPRNVAFAVVYADADLSKDDARKHAKEYGYVCPALLDPELTLALKVGATVKPEAAVLSPDGKLLYRGRIDDLYTDLGKKRQQPSRRDLKDALDAILAGKPVPVARTKAIGCDIEFPAKKK
jgi:hypothetical protein